MRIATKALLWVALGLLAGSVAYAQQQPGSAVTPTAGIDLAPRPPANLGLGRSPAVPDATGGGCCDTGPGEAQRVTLPSPCDADATLCEPPEDPPTTEPPTDPDGDTVDVDHCGMRIPNMYSRVCSPVQGGWYCPWDGYVEFYVCM